MLLSLGMRERHVHDACWKAQFKDQNTLENKQNRTMHWRIYSTLYRSASSVWGWCSRLTSGRELVSMGESRRLTAKVHAQQLSLLHLNQGQPHRRSSSSSILLSPSPPSSPSCEVLVCHQGPKKTWKWFQKSRSILVSWGIQAPFWSYYKVFWNVINLGSGGKTQTFYPNVWLPEDLLQWLIKQLQFD